MAHIFTVVSVFALWLHLSSLWQLFIVQSELSICQTRGISEGRRFVSKILPK